MRLVDPGLVFAVCSRPKGERKKGCVSKFGNFKIVIMKIEICNIDKESKNVK